MRPSIFNVTVPLQDGEVFLMNTLTDAQVRVSSDVVALLGELERAAPGEAAARIAASGSEAQHVVAFLAEQGFVVASRDDEQAALEQRFREFCDDTSELRVTVLTTLHCNFACGYCVQGDRAAGTSAHMDRMSLDTAASVAAWVEERLERLGSRRLVLTFFGGEPLLNLPVVYFLAERLWHAARSREVDMRVNVITNGLLLTPDVVDRLALYGLSGVKVTLDGHRAAHDRARPLRGGQGTFDRIIANLRSVAGRVNISIGGNFDADSVEHFPALIEFLGRQEFASSIGKVSFKPVIRRAPGPQQVEQRRGSTIPLTPVDERGQLLGGTCMTAAGAGQTSPCDGCHFVDGQMAFLRNETRRHGFATADGVHMGPCEIHRRHAYTIGPSGAMYACPGFTGDASFAVGHVDDRASGSRERADGFRPPEAWRRCGDCAFIPVCAGGCSVAAHHELGDMHAPACHKASFESALVSLAYEAAGTQERPGHENRRH